MFSYKTRLDRALSTAPVLAIDDLSKIVLMSDCHRGTGSLADDFLKHQHIDIAALNAYNRQKFTYIELGDGDELWENKVIGDIKAAHEDVFKLLKLFCKDHRLWMLYGNHDMVKRFRPEMFDTYCDGISNRAVPLFPGETVNEAIILRYLPGENDLMLVHGHQADFLNDVLWRLARFLVRFVWRRLEIMGVNNPTSAAKNNKVKSKVERRLALWAKEHNMPVIAGHTHKPVLPVPGQGLYFNDGSCVHPSFVTAMEIEKGCICLVKWGQMVREDGTMYVGREVIAGPYKLKEYFEGGKA